MSWTPPTDDGSDPVHRDSDDGAWFVTLLLGWIIIVGLVVVGVALLVN